MLSAGKIPARAPLRIDTVRRQFDRRAARLQQHDALLREVERRLLDKLEPIKLTPQRIVDVGCGAGHTRALLRPRFAQAEWIGVDLSAAMLTSAAGTAASRRGGWLRWRRQEPPWLLQADAGALPLADGCADLLLSNLMLHWHPQPHALFAEFKRVLRVGGLLLFSCFGPDTLQELRAAFRTWPRTRPMPFVDMHDFGDMLVASGFADPVLDAERIVLTYPSPAALLREASALGGNPRDDRPAVLPPTAAARQVLAALAAHPAGDGRYALSFEIAYGHAWKPAPRQPGAVLIPLDRLQKSLPRRAEPAPP
jgi:malonyl-CoA O-methyltransferase